MSAAPLALALLHAAQVVSSTLAGHTADSALADLNLDGVLRAATQDLAFGALRAYGRGDFFLSRLIIRPLGEPVIRSLLLVALARLEARPETAHTTVNQAVEASARLVRGRYRGLVNGVLRNFLRQRETLFAATSAQRVAEHRYPDWWLVSLQAAFPERWAELAAVGNTHPPMTLRVNRRLLTSAEYAQVLSESGIDCRILDTSAIQLIKPVPVDRLPGFGEGRVSVQDWGAQHAAALLDTAPGMRVLDACAAPGGKTGHLLERHHLDLLALDADSGRARRIKENLSRLHLSASVQVADCRDVPRWWDGRLFDRVLADVPCSASGVVRRHPDIKWLRRPDDIARFVVTQREILDALWQVVAPGGKMLYATCSLFPAENSEQIAAFVIRHPDAQRLPTGEGDNEWPLLPCADHDGFYYALLAKRR